MNLQLDDFKESGLYLIFPDRTHLAITREKMEEFAHRFLKDPSIVPPAIKKAVDFQNCSICPKRDTGEFCHALFPMLPFMGIVDRFFSYEKVIAVYRGQKGELFCVPDITVQRALQYVSMLSLMYYCETGRKYLRYFCGIIPLMDSEQVVSRMYLNIYWDCKGDEQKIIDIINRFNEEITITSKCQIKRLNLISNKDAFMNAFTNTQIQTELLSLSGEETLEKLFKDFEESA